MRSSAAGMLLAFVAAIASAGHLESALEAVRSSNLMPHFETRNGKQTLFVDGHPFIALAVEIPWYQTSYGRYRETMTAYDYLYPAARRMHLNTVKVPVKWSQIEPRKNAFDFSYLDHVRSSAEQNGLKVILGWFGHYASGRAGNIYRNLDNEVWAPMDIIEDDRTYPRAVDADGKEHHNAISYDSDGVIEREAAAFAACMRHIRDIDSKTHTIVMVQVENEISVFGAGESSNRKMWRDHSVRSNELFAASGFDDDLRFSAARFASNWLRRVTAAGGAEYPIPFYMNFIGGKLASWMTGGAPGEDAATYLDRCPFISFIALNLYSFGATNTSDLRKKIEEYRLGRNLTAISETNSDRSSAAPALAFLAIGEYAAPLFSPWALNVSFPVWGEPYVLRDGTLANGAFDLARAYQAIAKAMPPIATYSGGAKLKVFLSQTGPETLDIAAATVTAANGPGGQAMVLHPQPNEFLVIGWRTAVTLASPLARWPALKKVRIEAGRWEDARWMKEPDGHFLGVAEQNDGVFRVRLFEEPTVVRLYCD